MECVSCDLYSLRAKSAPGMVPPGHACLHYEVWKYCQSTSRVQAEVQQILRVCLVFLWSLLTGAGKPGKFPAKNGPPTGSRLVPA